MEHQRQEQLRAERQERQKAMNLAQASVWGNASANLSWAPKPGSNNANQNSPKAQNVSAKKSNNEAQSLGFWEDQPVPKPQQQQQQPQQSTQQKKNRKKVREEDKVAAIFKESRGPKNDFEAWCTKALNDLNAQVDIPTFLAFLQDIESPYEVNERDITT